MPKNKERDERKERNRSRGNRDQRLQSKNQNTYDTDDDYWDDPADWFASDDEVNSWDFDESNSPTPMSPPSPLEPKPQECSEKRALNDRRIPAIVFEIFSNVKPNTEVVKILKKIQDEEDRYCQAKQENCTTASAKRINRCSIHEIYAHFKTVNYADFDQEDGRQILAYLRKPILKIPSYGALFYNLKEEVLLVQNYRGIWTVPHDHPKIKDNHQLETIPETVSRKFNQMYDVYDIDKEHDLKLEQFIEFDGFDPLRVGNNTQRLGLLLIPVDESKLEFTLQNTNEYQICQWIKLDKIFDSTTKNDQDIYYSLKPFVGKLKYMFLFNGSIPNNK